MDGAARADVGLVRAGMVVAMAAIFVGALFYRDAWSHGTQPINAALAVVITQIVGRVVFVLLSWFVAGGGPPLRIRVLFPIITVILGWVPLIVGAELGGAAQNPLWAAAVLIEAVGSWIFGRHRTWVPSPSHLAERHGLVLVIAIGGSLASVGIAGGPALSPTWSLVIVALLQLTVAWCLWWLYFENAAGPAGRALAREPGQERSAMGVDAYGLIHFLLITGVLYQAHGTVLVLNNIGSDRHRHVAGSPLDWTATVSLYGGVMLYLAGRAVFLRLTVGHTPPAQIVAIAVVLAVLPAARLLPAVAAFGLLAAVLLAVVGYERLTWKPQAPARKEPARTRPRPP